MPAVSPYPSLQHHHLPRGKRLLPGCGGSWNVGIFKAGAQASRVWGRRWGAKFWGSQNVLGKKRVWRRGLTSSLQRSSAWDGGRDAAGVPGVPSTPGVPSPGIRSSGRTEAKHTQGVLIFPFQGCPELCATAASALLLTLLPCPLSPGFSSPRSTGSALTRWCRRASSANSAAPRASTATACAAAAARTTRSGCWCPPAPAPCPAATRSSARACGKPPRSSPAMWPRGLPAGNTSPGARGSRRQPLGLCGWRNAGGMPGKGRGIRCETLLGSG